MHPSPSPASSLSLQQSHSSSWLCLIEKDKRPSYEAISSHILSNTRRSPPTNSSKLREGSLQAGTAYRMFSPCLLPVTACVWEMEAAWLMAGYRDSSPPAAVSYHRASSCHNITPCYCYLHICLYLFYDFITTNFRFNSEMDEQFTPLGCC